jgi:hypothetical protein
MRTLASKLCKEDVRENQGENSYGTRDGVIATPLNLVRNRMAWRKVYLPVYAAGRVDWPAQTHFEGRPRAEIEEIYCIHLYGTRIQVEIMKLL